MPRCPSCNKLMTHSTQENVRLNTCPGCFGIWIEKIALNRLARTPAPPPADGSPEQSLQELAEIVVESNTKGRLHCPVCPVDLVKDRYHPLIPVEVDRCPKCAAVWLDVGELPLLRRLFAELQSSTDPQVMALRDKVANTALAMEQMHQRTRDLQDINTGTGPLGFGGYGSLGAGSSPEANAVGITMDVLINLLTR